MNRSGSKDQVLAKDDLVKKAKENRMKSACTEFVKNDDDSDGGVYRWRPVCGTSPEMLGDLGVGIRLYFDFLFLMGLCFLVLAVLSMPMLLMNAKGSMLDESEAVDQFFGSLSLANFGHCRGGGCRSSKEMRDRHALADTSGLHVFVRAAALSELRARDVTEWLGLLDGLGIIVFSLFGILFQYGWVPRVVRANDDQYITPADYALQIHGLPWRLASGHEKYEESLKAHLQSVLQRVGVDDQHAIQEIALVRDYRGAIGQFMAQGANHLQMDEHVAQRNMAHAAGKEGEVAKIEKSIAKHTIKIDKEQEALCEHGKVAERDREVRTAFVMLNTEDQQARLLHEYRFAQTGFFRLCQDKRLRFQGCRLKLTAPCEPSDLIWENLDFAPWKRQLRRVLVYVVTLAVLLVCSACLLALQSPVALEDGPSGTRAWVLMNLEDSGAPCLRVCEWQLIQDQGCIVGSSDSNIWQVERIFDAMGNVSEAVADGSTDCTQHWTSPRCSDASTTDNASGIDDALGRDWIAIEFAQDRSVNVDVRCMRLHQPNQGSGSKFRLLACRHESLPAATSDTSTWRPDDQCSPMQDVGMGVDVSNGAPVVPDTLCRTQVTYEAASQAIESGADPVQDAIVSCFCTQHLPDVRIPPYDTPSKVLCEEWSRAMNARQAITAGTVLAVLALNQVLFAILPVLVGFERRVTETEATQDTMTMIFAALFVNTGVLVLLVNWETLGGAYNDFNAEFFPKVGSGLCMTIALQTLSNTSPQIAMSFIVTPVLSWLFQRSTASQAMLDKVYQLPDWDLSLRLAQVMNMIFCVLMWSGSMPILYSFGLVYCFVAYWIDKTVLLRGSHRPPMYNEHVILGALHFFPIAAFLHAMVSLWIFGRQDLFPSDWSALAWLPEILFRMTTADSERVIEEFGASVEGITYVLYANARCVDFGRKACWLLCLIFVFFVGLYVVRFVWSFLLRPLCNPLEVLAKEFSRTCCGRCTGGRSKKSEIGQRPFKEEQDRMKQQGMVCSYKFENNDRYSDACRALGCMAAPPAVGASG